MFTKEDYVSFETAKLLKEIGYDEPCKSTRWKNGELRLYDTNQTWDNMISLLGKDYYEFLCPTLYEAQKWLRKTHNLNIEVDFDESQLWGYSICGCNKNDGLEDTCSMFSTYEQALDKGIQDALDFIKMNNTRR